MNLSAHKIAGLRQAIEAEGAKLLLESDRKVLVENKNLLAKSEGANI